MTSRTQAIAVVSTNTATFGATPVQGSLLTCMAAERSDSSLDMQNAGWSVAFSDRVTGDTTYRRSITCWWKFAGASEPTTIQVNNSESIIIQEFALDPGESWGIALTDVGSNNNGNVESNGITWSLPTINSNTTSAIVIAAATTKEDCNFVSWSNGVGNNVTASGANRNALFAGWKQAANATETTDLTLSGIFRGISAGIFTLEVVPPAGSISGNVALSGTPIQGATVFAVDRNSNEYIGSTTTDANGDYTLTVPVNVPMHVVVEYESGGQKYNALSHWNIMVT